ncbi:MAG: TonB-dependent receptor, plug, partial [Bryobacterales bacterium]|nr:TonB-dependent receptor, plug [Bryobacterales bacterium]
MKGLRWIAIIAPLYLLCAVPAYSQAVNGTLLGTVTDTSGGSVASAKVTLTETNTRIVKIGQTNASGNYAFPDIPPGLYSVEVEMAGFKKEIKGGITVEANTSPRADIQLQPGNVSETIEVSATSSVLQTERADTGRSMDAQIVEELPLGVNRNFQSLLDLVPGTSVETFQHSQFFNASSSLQTNVNGQPRMGNNFQIEGIDNNERTGLLQVLITPAEAIQTVNVSTSNHDPELGR